MNPDAQTQVETVAKSYVPEAAVPTVLSPEETVRRNEAKALRARYEKTKDSDPYAALKAPEVSSDLSTVDTDKEVKGKIHEAERDSTGTIDHDQQALIDGALQAAREAKAIAEKGLDGIVDVSGNADTVRQQTIIDLYITRVLDVRGAFAGLTQSEKNAIARAELQKPEVRLKIAELLKQKLNPSEQTQTDQDKELATKQKQKKEKKREARETKIKLRKAKKELQDLEQIQNEHAAINSSGVEGLRHAEIRSLGNAINVGTIKQLREALISRRNPQGFQEIYQLVGQKLQTGDVLADDYEEGVAELIRQEQLVVRYKALIQEGQSLDERIKAATEAVKEARRDRRKVKREISDLDDDIDDLEEPRDQREQALAGSLSRIITEAGNQVLTQEADRRLQMLRIDAEEKQKTAAEEDRKRLLGGIGSRWEKVVMKGGKWVIEEYPLQIEEDWQNAISTGKVLPQVIEVLTQHTRIDTHDTPEQREKKRKEYDRIVERLKTDQDFADYAIDNYLTALIGRRLQGEKPIPDGERRLIDQYDWFKYASDFVDAQNKQDQESQKRISTLLTEAGKNQEHKLEALRQEYGDNWSTILNILFSGAEIPSRNIFSRLFKTVI